MAKLRCALTILKWAEANWPSDGEAQEHVLLPDSEGKLTLSLLHRGEHYPISFDEADLDLDLENPALKEGIDRLIAGK